MKTIEVVTGLWFVLTAVMMVFISGAGAGNAVEDVASAIKAAAFLSLIASLGVWAGYGLK